MKNVPGQGVQSGASEVLPGQIVNRRNPQTNRRRPSHLQEFETEDKVDKLQTSTDFCYRAVCDIPQTYQDAIASTKSKQCKKRNG